MEKTITLNFMVLRMQTTVIMLCKIKIFHKLSLQTILYVTYESYALLRVRYVYLPTISKTTLNICFIHKYYKLFNKLLPE